MKYTLVGVDGNAYAIMGYVHRIMRREGFPTKEISEYTKRATSGNYNNLLYESIKMVDICNDKAKGEK